jgi:tetraacyldisaccharide 4'-kinase
VLTPGQRPTWWLAWAAIPYRLVARLRTFGYEAGWFRRHKLLVPVVSIGNLTVGGTGKTPIIIELAERLLRDGKRVGVLSRGYRRTTHAPMLLVSDGVRLLAGPREAGDEPYLIARRCPKAVVAVGVDRYRLGRWVLSQFAVDCFLLDDGFQHMGLHRDLDVLLIDATDALGLDQVLPAGRLREPLEAAGRATAIIVTRAEKQTDVEEILSRLRSAVQHVPMTAQVTFHPQALQGVMTGVERSLESCQGKSALLVSGVGHAASFRATAGRLGLKVLEEVVHADHHCYTGREVARLRQFAADLGADLVLTTEKDAGKIQPYLTQDDHRWWAVRLMVVWTAGEAALHRKIMDELSRPRREAGD